MILKYEISDQASGPVLILRDQMTFDDRDGFIPVIDKILARQSAQVVVDLSDLNYMDSAGLGMLLTLRDRAQKTDTQVILRNPKADVSNLLRLACFDTLFTIQS